MQFLTLGRRSYTFPSNYNELTPAQLRRVCLLLHTSTLTQEQAIPLLLKYCSSRPWWQLLWYSYDLFEQQHLADFIFTETLTVNKFPQYRGLHAPKNDFSNAITTEYFFANQYFEAWAHSHADADLNYFIATLYRPAKPHYNTQTDPDGDIRSEYNDNLTPWLSRRVARWPLAVKLSIAKWFEGVVLQLKQRYPRPFAPGGAVAEFGFYEVLSLVAQKGNHGPQSVVEKLPIHTFLIELSLVLKES